MENLVNKEVYCKRQASRGVVVGQDALTVTIDVAGVEKVVTHNTFKRWYTVVPQEILPVEEKPKKVKKIKEEKDEEPVVQDEDRDLDVGLDIRRQFFRIIHENTPEGVNFFYKPHLKQDVIKYNGKNVFECTHSKKKYTVLAHPDSLTPENKKKATKIYPKEWDWALRAQFVFTDPHRDFFIMKSIVVDGFYFRSKDFTGVSPVNQ